MYGFQLPKDSVPKAVSSSGVGNRLLQVVKVFPETSKDESLLILSSATSMPLPWQSQSSSSSNASANTAAKKLFSCQPVQPAAEQKSPMQLRDEISEANQVILSPWRSPHYTLKI